MPKNEVNAKLLVDKPGIKVLRINFGDEPMAVGIGTPRDTETDTGVAGRVNWKGGGGSVKREVATSENEWKWLYWREAFPSKWIQEEEMKGFLKTVASTASAGSAIIAESAPFTKPTEIHSGSFVAHVDEKGDVRVEETKKQI